MKAKTFQKEEDNSIIALMCLHAQSFRSCPTLWDPMDWIACQGPLSMGSQARILEWLPSPPPGDLPDPGIKTLSPVSLALQLESLLTEPP